jgi:hypothetical protein
MHDDFDKQFNRVLGAGVAAFVFYLLLVFAGIGVGIWAVIELVNHFTN